ncbi:amino acid ABC transporter ATP-binding protein [Taklimakanibacter lacteus]|uniref:amino acid ABC transporter ATP-binding protein n=1 Tax=Taklimakanibacter lacteus TaxID=2268456 RepID=UPI000E673A84
MAALLRVDDLYKDFAGLKVLKGVSMTLERGHKTAIIGPSGCGKSTLLRCINYMETPTAGHIHLDGELFGETQNGGKYQRMSEKQLARQRSQVGMVFQGFYLWPHLNARDNVAIAPMKVRGMEKRAAYELADAMLEKVHMSHKRDEFPERLSGGQQQRVAIARALAQQPKLMLFDEPTSALDPELVGEVLKVIQELAAEGISMVLVTHEVRFARQVADHVIFLGDGVVVEEGAPDQVIGAPKHERLRSFLKQILEH